MKKQPILTAIVILAVGVTLASCRAVGSGMEGNIYEKMSIFSLIALTFIAVILIPFVSSTTDSKALSRYRELIRNADPFPLTFEELTGNPVYHWDSRKSIHKMLFSTDGSFSESVIVTSNGLDPTAQPCGTWALTAEGKLQITRKIAASSRALTRVSQNGYNLVTLMRHESGSAEAWFLGENSLANAQITCFGYSESQPSAEKFTAALIRGVTIYWATYPAVALTSENEPSVNPELAYGVLIFHPDGTLSKSINNPIDASADWRPSFNGTWKVDENFGVLNMSVGLYTTEVTLLLHSAGSRSLLVGTTAGNEQWFLDQEKAQQDLLAHLATTVHLDARKGELFA